MAPESSSVKVHGAAESRRISRPRFNFSLKTITATIVVAAMLVLGSIVILVGQYAASQAILTTTTYRVGNVGRLISEKMGRILEPAQATLRDLSFDPITTADTVDERLARAYVLIEQLSANQLISSIYLGNANGDFFLARRLDQAEVRRQIAPPRNAAYLIQSVSHAPGHEVKGEFIFYDSSFSVIERRPQPDYKFDARSRPWYSAAMHSNGTAVLSDPYVFFTTGQTGITLSRQSRSRNSVEGIDVALDTLAGRLNELRLTPGTEMALISTDDRVLAYQGASHTHRQHDAFLGMQSIQTLGSESLAHLLGIAQHGSTATRFYAGNRSWIGTSVPLDTWPTPGMRLLVAAPTDELTTELRGQQMRMLLIIVLGGLALLPFGWWAGRSIGHSLDRLIIRSERIRHFDFHHEGKPLSSGVREVTELSTAMDTMTGTIDHFLQISQQLATETDMESMLASVLQQVMEATRCISGAVYLWDYKEHIMRRAELAGDHNDHLRDEFEYLPDESPRSRHRQVGHLQQVEWELRGRSGQLQGLLILLHAGQARDSDTAFSEFTGRLSGMLAVSIETRQLIDAQKELLNALIRLMADAIDAKSPYTGGHCERVPELAMLLVDQMSQDTKGPYRAFKLDGEKRYEFYLGAWLHDCGKVTSPEHIVDKATKLELIHNRIHELRARFEILWRDAEIAHLKRLAAGEPEVTSTITLNACRQQLSDDFAFVAQCNQGGEFLPAESIDRLHKIASQPWLRHFDNRLGLSAGELQRLIEVEPNIPSLPAVEQLLADRPEHLIPWGSNTPPVEKDNPQNRYGFDMALPSYQQNAGELYNLAIPRGTLTAEDRFKINNHIVQTYIMLKNLPWPQNLSRVPEIAATHHEKMDGTGYPRKLSASQLNIIDRVMALSDVFEALTAADRPYKSAKSLSESLRIMAFMCKDRHLDTELFRYFLHSEIWKVFAQRYMHASQIDTVNISDIDELLPERGAESVQ